MSLITLCCDTSPCSSLHRYRSLAGLVLVGVLRAVYLIATHYFEDPFTALIYNNSSAAKGKFMEAAHRKAQ